METEKQISHMGIANWIGVSVVVLSLSVLAGWLFNIESIVRVSPHLSAMNPSTAVLFIVLASSFLLVGRKNNEKSGMSLSIAKAFLVAVILFSASRIADIVLGDIMQVDSLIFSEKIAQATAPARMSLSTATSFLFLGISLFLALSGMRRFSILGQLGVVVALSISGLALFLYPWKSVIFLENPFYCLKFGSKTPDFQSVVSTGIL